MTMADKKEKPQTDGIQIIENFIDGQSVPAKDYIDNINPATGAVYSRVPDSGEDDLSRAVDAAKKAFPAWRDTPVEQRAAIMNRMADLLKEHMDVFIDAEIADGGMTRKFASTAEVPRGEGNFRAFARVGPGFSNKRPFKQDRPGAPYAEGYVTSHPVGTVGVISPWNLPLLLFTWKIAPALVTGNCVIAKPSELTPMTAAMLGNLANEAGFPPGVLNILHGRGDKIGAALVKHPDILRVSFTGSTKTGYAIQEEMARARKAPPSLEMGGKNAAIIFDDADFEAAVEGTKISAFANQGQVCLCTSRILVQRSIYNKFRDALVEKANAMTIGDPNDPATDIGAVNSEPHMNKILSYIDLAKQEGGKILCGGKRRILDGVNKGGYFIEPTLIEGLDNRTRTNQEEIFGPVATLIPFDTEEEAVAIANDSDYGLCATIWTKDSGKACRVADRLETGMPWINSWFLRALETPFGGFKSSGNGKREGVPDAMEFYTEKKTVTYPKL